MKHKTETTSGFPPPTITHLSKLQQNTDYKHLHLHLKIIPASEQTWLWPQSGFALFQFSIIDLEINLCYCPGCGGVPSLSSSQDEDVKPAGAEMEWGAVVWPRPWYRPTEDGEEGMEVAAATTGSWEVEFSRPVCSVCSGRAAAPKYILLGRPRKVRPEGSETLSSLISLVDNFTYRFVSVSEMKKRR